jgi:predicted DNA-binding transcriptional regulator AlpA
MQLVVLTEEQFNQINDKLDALLSREASEVKEKKEWLNSQEAMDLLGIGYTTLWRYGKEDKLTVRRIGKKRYFNAHEVVQLIENSKEN